ncbi:MAG: M56 family metallopeptidase [Cyanobacteria bacterium P01_E01_bin.34]
MHLLLLAMTLGVALIIRLLPVGSERVRNASITQQDWFLTLLAFALPPLLIVASSLAVVLMGPGGHMHMHAQANPCVSLVSHLVSLGLLVVASFFLVRRGWEGWRSSQQFVRYPLCHLAGHMGRVLPHEVPFAARTGFWNSDLLLSQGLVDDLPAEQVQAVLQHEQAHEHFHDTFWFFWLGWLRQIGGWLPKTEALWQQLLLLRELRADAMAATRCDRLVLAEALFQVASAPLPSSALVAAFGEDSDVTRLETRIDALLDEQASFNLESDRSWYWGWVACLPLLVVPFCHC